MWIRALVVSSVSKARNQIPARCSSPLLPLSTWEEVGRCSRCLRTPWSCKARHFLDTPFCHLPFSVPLDVRYKSKAKRRVLNPRYSNIVVCGSPVPSTNQFSTGSSGFFFLIHMQAATLLKAPGSLAPRLPEVALAHHSSQPCSKHDLTLDPRGTFGFSSSIRKEATNLMVLKWLKGRH